MDEHVDTISDNIKKVDARNNPIKETHIVNRVPNLSVRVGSLEPAVIGIGIIGQGSTQFITNRDTNIGLAPLVSNHGSLRAVPAPVARGWNGLQEHRYMPV